MYALAQDLCSDEDYDTIARFAALFRSVVFHGKYLGAADLVGSVWKQHFSKGELFFSDKPDISV
jgi:hypothetical protein